MGRFIDESGNRYGNISVLSLAAAVPGNPGAMWLCRCESCGRELTIRGRALRFNQPTACIACCKHKHEESKSPEYDVWFCMIRRCGNPTAINYRHYGGRGISVCKRWREGTAKLHPFQCFLADMGRRPDAKHSLDRIDGNGNYRPGNTRWASREVQANNRVNNVRVKVGGRKLTITEAARHFDVPPSKLRYRMSKGLSVTEAVALIRGISSPVATLPQVQVGRAKTTAVQASR